MTSHKEKNKRTTRVAQSGIVLVPWLVAGALGSIGALLFAGGPIANMTIGALFNGLMQLAFSLLGIVFAIVGWLLDISVQLALNTQNYAMDAVRIGWGVLRDIANIAFIFIVLYIAIKTILRLGNIDTKQALVNVIIMAFLVNFSLFFTQIIIDTSNILATFFYNNITSVTVNGQQAGIGTIFTSLLKPQTLFDATKFTDLNQFETGLAYLFGSVGLLLTIFSFLAVAIMFIARIAVLIILMMLSPIAFVAWILEDFREYFTKWWKTLLNQSFFAPAYLLVAYVVVLVVYQINTTIFKDASLAAPINAIKTGGAGGGLIDISTANIVGAFSSTGGTLGPFTIFFTYFLILFLINGALVVAKQMGGATAGFGVKWADKIKGYSVGGLKKGAKFGWSKAVEFGERTLTKKTHEQLQDKDYVAKQMTTRTGRFILGAQRAVSKGYGEQIKKEEEFVRGFGAGATKKYIEKVAPILGAPTYDPITKDVVVTRDTTTLGKMKGVPRATAEKLIKEEDNTKKREILNAELQKIKDKRINRQKAEQERAKTSGTAYDPDTDATLQGYYKEEGEIQEKINQLNK